VGVRKKEKHAIKRFGKSTFPKHKGEILKEPRTPRGLLLQPSNRLPKRKKGYRYRKIVAASGY